MPKINLEKPIKRLKKKKNSVVKQILTGLVVVFFVFYILSLLATLTAPPGNEISLSEALEKIKNKQVKEITITDSRIQIQLANDEIVFTQKEPTTSFTQILKEAEINPTEVSLRINNQDAVKTIADIIATFAPLVLTAIIFWYIFKQAGKAQSSIFSFGKSKAKVFRRNGRATFNDVAGLEEAKEELQEVVDFLKSPEKYRKMGARTPKGVLLIGPSGTGKTLLARAIAGEAKVPFLHMAGSEFMEMLVGVGASRVRDLFQTARKAGRAIIFIDEVDAIGGVRGIGVAAGHSEREQTLNQLLVEMDGLEPNETIIILAATNRPDILDPALTRPGRFDRRIALNFPDLEEREKILKLHAKGKPFAKEVSWKTVSRRTVGYSGADLENMLNEAAILAARVNKKTIGVNEINEAMIKIKLGPQKKRAISEDEKKISAYHESGHAIVSHYLPKMDPVERISIISRGPALGYTLLPPEKDRVHEDKTYLLSQITSLMGGRAAEEFVFQEITSGASADIQQATRIARRMVIKYGMSPLGPLYFGPQIDIAEWGQSFVQPQEISPKMQARVDAEIKRIVDQAYKKAQELIKKHKTKLDQVAKKLLEKETLERDDFEKIIKGR